MLVLSLEKQMMLYHPNSRSSKSFKKELKNKHDKLERIHNELITSHNKLKEEYTTLKINHDNLIIAQEYLSNEPHDATNHVVKIDIATSYDDLIVESI